MAQNCYSEATWENGQLEIRLGVSQATLHAAEEEASAVRARLAESDAIVAGKMNSLKAFCSDFHNLHLDRLLVFMIVSPDSIVGISPTGGEHDHRRCQCPGFLHRHLSPRYPSLYPGGCPSQHSPWRISGSTTAQVQTGHDLHTMEVGFLIGDGPEEHKDLLEEFIMAAEAIVDITSAQDVVNKDFN